jgi:hypothetical protein
MTIKEEMRRCSRLSDDELWSAMPRLARTERVGIVSFLVHLMEIKRRELHVKRAYSGLFTFLIKLGFSEWDAHARSVAVDVAGKYPCVLGLLGVGRLTLSTLEAIAPVLSSTNYRGLLGKASRRSRRDVEKLVAGVKPQPARRDVVRVVSAPSPFESPPGTPATQPADPATDPAGGPGSDLFGSPIKNFAPQAEATLYSISFTASQETHDLLLRAKELLRHRFPKAGTDEIVNFAIKCALAEEDRDLRRPRRHSKPADPGAAPNRYILESVKQETWERDGGQCAFIAPDGTRCTARAWLEFDHELPFALGGSSRDSRNVRPLCFPHNQWAAKQTFGGTRRDNS